MGRPGCRNGPITLNGSTITRHSLTIEAILEGMDFLLFNSVVQQTVVNKGRSVSLEVLYVLYQMVSASHKLPYKL